jgi:hypothetical protein
LKLWRKEIGIPEDNTMTKGNALVAIKLFTMYAHERQAVNPHFPEYHRNAIDRALRRSGMSFEDSILKDPGFPDRVWTEFEAQCPKDGGRPKSNEDRTIGPVKGVLSLLAKESEPNWVILMEKQPNQKVAFDLVNGLKGIGDKLAAFMVRDLYTIFGLWPSLPGGQEYTVQPLDVQVERWAQACWSGVFVGIPEKDNIGRMQNISSKCRDERIPPADFNKGAWFVGRQFGRFMSISEFDEDGLKALLSALHPQDIKMAIEEASKYTTS